MQRGKNAVRLRFRVSNRAGRDEEKFRLPENPTHSIAMQAAWLNSLLQQDDDAEVKKAFARVPEFVVKDLADWLIFVIK